MKRLICRLRGHRVVAEYTLSTAVIRCTRCGARGL